MTLQGNNSNVNCIGGFTKLLQSLTHLEARQGAGELASATETSSWPKEGQILQQGRAGKSPPLAGEGNHLVGQKNLCRPNSLASGHSNRQLIAILLLLAATCCSASTLKNSPFDQELHSAERKFNDPSCSWDREQLPSEGEKLLMILKCDVKPLKRSFELLLAKFNGPQRLANEADVSQLVSMSQLVGEEAENFALAYREFVAIDNLIDSFEGFATKAMNYKEFCTYSSVQRFNNLKNLISSEGNRSKSLTILYDLIAIEFHQYCLNEALKKLPSIPSNIKEIVDIYIDGKDSELIDLNRPAGFADEKKDEFSFDLERALARNGPLEEVVSLIMDMSFITTTNEERVKKFKRDCERFLIEIEERWQAMEMMNNILSTDSNGIKYFNNYLMRALIPTKYADVCSQLSSAS